MTTTILTPTCHLTSISVICSHCRLTISSLTLTPTTSLLSTTSCLAISNASRCSADRYTERIRAFTVAIIATLFTSLHFTYTCALLLLLSLSPLTFCVALLMFCSPTVWLINTAMCHVVLSLTCNCNPMSLWVSGLTTTA